MIFKLHPKNDAVTEIREKINELIDHIEELQKQLNERMPRI